MLKKAQIKSLDIIQPIDGTLPEDCWDDTSYNLRLGRQFVLITEEPPKISDSSEFGIHIPPLGCVLVSTDEWVKMPLGIYGRWGLRIRHALSGLVFQAGPQIEPGYQGRLFGLLFNLSTTKRHLRYRESIWSIDFTAVAAIPKKPAERLPEESIKLNVTDYATYDPPAGSIAGAFGRLESDLKAYRKEASEQANNLRLQRDELFERILTEAKHRASLAQTFLFGFVLVLVCTVISTAVPAVIAKSIYDRDEFVREVKIREAENKSRIRLLEQQLIEIRARLNTVSQAPKQK